MQKNKMWKIGEKYFLRTVTYHIVGKLVDVKEGFLVFKDCSWVADSGRFMQAIETGTLSEVEPVGNWFCSISSIVDGGVWKHDLPKEQK